MLELHTDKQLLQGLPLSTELEVLRELGRIEKKEAEAIEFDVIAKNWADALAMTAGDFINTIKV